MADDRTVVFIHGAWHGGWCWQRVSRPLAAAGWQVFTPTLSGCGDRAHVASEDTSMETFVQDVVSLIEMEDLRDLVLCGHSAGGVVATGVADRVADRIRHLVYLDATVPGDGQSLCDVVGEESGFPQVFRDQAGAGGKDWLVSVGPALSAAAFGIDDAADAAWLEERLVPHPMVGFFGRVSLTGAVDRLPRTYVRCTQFVVPMLDVMLERLEALDNVDVERWEIGHDVMVLEPERVRQLIERV